MTFRFLTTPRTQTYGKSYHEQSIIGLSFDGKFVKIYPVFFLFFFFFSEIGCQTECCVSFCVQYNLRFPEHRIIALGQSS